MIENNLFSNFVDVVSFFEGQDFVLYIFVLLILILFSLVLNQILLRIQGYDL